MPIGEQPLNALEREITLLARHYLSMRRVQRGRTLENSAYLLLGRLEVADAPLTLKQLAQTLHVDVSTINRQVAALLRQGLVERIPDPDGGIARKLRPTDLGLRRLADDREASRHGTGRVVEGWQPRQVEELAALLRRFNATVERLEGQPWPRPETD